MEWAQSSVGNSEQAFGTTLRLFSHQPATESLIKTAETTKPKGILHCVMLEVEWKIHYSVAETAYLMIDIADRKVINSDFGVTIGS